MKITIEVVGSVYRVEIDGQAIQESDGGAIAAVKGKARLADHETVEPSPSDVSDGGLNIVHKHTEIALASQGEQEAQSLGGELIIVGANTGGGHVTDGGNAQDRLAGALVNAAPASKVSVLRPHCKHKDACGGYGFNHCHGCLRGVNAEGSAA